MTQDWKSYIRKEIHEALTGRTNGHRPKGKVNLTNRIEDL